MQTLEILVVEDHPGHRQDAEAIVHKLQQQGAPIRVHYAEDRMGASACLDAQQYDAVITDIFMPTEGTQVTERDTTACACFLEMTKRMIGWIGDPYKTRFAEAARAWGEGRALPPLGVLVAEESARDGIPVVFCTDTYHHGDATEPVCQYARSQRIPVVDDPQEVGSSPRKDWRRAFDYAFLQYAMRQGEDRLLDLVHKARATPFRRVKAEDAERVVDAVLAARGLPIEQSTRDGGYMDCVIRDYVGGLEHPRV